MEPEIFYKAKHKFKDSKTFSDWYPVILAGLLKERPVNADEVNKLVTLAIDITNELIKQLDHSEHAPDLKAL